MAKFNSYLLGKVKKSVGNVTMCYTNKQNIAKAKIFSRRDNPTPEILDQRAKMKVLVQLSRRLIPVIRKGFVGMGNGTTSNAFMKVNQAAVEVDEKHVATIVFDRLKMAEGLLYTPNVTVTYARRVRCILSSRRCRKKRRGMRWRMIKCMACCWKPC